MEIVLAKSAGFCFGVRRATQMAFEAADKHENICSLGPVIHSPQVVKGLAEQGVRVVSNVEDIPPRFGYYPLSRYHLGRNGKDPRKQPEHYRCDLSIC